MKIEEIEDAIQNGFHDAMLKRIELDYVNQTAKLDLSVDISDPHSWTEDSTKVYRDGILTLSELLFCIIEPPVDNYLYKSVEGLWITNSGPVVSPDLSSKLPKEIPDGAFVHYFFINEWNAFIFLGARNASFEWSG